MLPGLDVLLAVVPRPARVGHHDRHQGAGQDAARQEADQALGPEHHAEDHGRHAGHDARGHHLPEGRPGHDVDARAVVRLGGPLEDPQGELPPHLLDHGPGRPAHREHGEAAEDVRQDAPDQHAGHDLVAGCVDDVGDQRVVLRGHFLLEGDQQGQGGQDRRADGEPLPGRGGGVPEGVQGVRPVADLGVELGHLGDAPGVVHHGTVRVGREGHPEGGEHPHGPDGHAVHAGQLQADHDGGGEDGDGRDGGEHAHGEPADQHGGRARLGRLGDALDRVVGPGRGVLGGLADQEARDQANEDDGEEVEGVLEPEGLDDHPRESDDAGPGGQHAVPQGLQQVLLGGPVLGPDVQGAEDGAHDAGGGNVQREGHPGFPVHLVAEGRRSDDAADVRLEEVGPHAGRVADVVPHAVGDRGGVPRVVLGNAGLDLADEVGADVGGLGVDPPADPGEQGDAGRAEPEPGEVLEGEGDVLVQRGEDDEEQGHPDEPGPHHHHAHDAAGVERHAQGRVQSVDGGGRRPHVTPDRHGHADPPSDPRDEGPGHEGDGRCRVPHEHSDQRGDHGHEHGEPLVLLLQEGRGPLLDGGGDLLHLDGPGGHRDHLLAQVVGEQERDAAGGDGRHAHAVEVDLHLDRLRAAHHGDFCEEDHHEDDAEEDRGRPLGEEVADPLQEPAGHRQVRAVVRFVVVLPVDLGVQHGLLLLRRGGRRRAGRSAAASRRGRGGPAPRGGEPRQQPHSGGSGRTPAPEGAPHPPAAGPPSPLLPSVA